MNRIIGRTELLSLLLRKSRNIKYLILKDNEIEKKFVMMKKLK